MELLMTNDIQENSPPKNLLLVDDEIEITRTLQRFFRKNYTVYVAGGANEAFNIVNSNNINVIISDQRMPGMTGVEFLANIRKEYPDIIRLLLTGYTDINSVISAINEGNIYRYITKPWNYDELNAVVGAAFEKHSLIRKNKILMDYLRNTNQILENKVEERTKELSEMNRQLIEINNEKNRFLGIAAHDLRNPIGTALSFTDLLLQDFDAINNSDKKQYLRLILGRCEFSLKLLNELLDISKIEAGKIELDLQIYDYKGFISEVVHLNQSLANQKKTKLTIEWKAGNIALKFDWDKIEQVLNNLINNAVKYSPPGKEVVIKVENEGEFLKTIVCDQGHGIPEEEVSLLFRPFQKASPKPTGGESSTGLGLAIVKKIVEVHNGKVSVESKVNVGSNFSFTLPLVV